MEDKKGKKEIRAVFTESTVRVYQAYSPVIADEAVRKGTFGEHFSLNRMTWIKPSFLWMMYRCGWAQKPGQERVLAIDIHREAFDEIIHNAVSSSYHPESGISMEQWKQAVARSDIRCQWDPERDIYGNPLPCRSIQLGLRGKAVYNYVNHWIIQISDITEYVHCLLTKRDSHISIEGLIPQEKNYPISKGLPN